eukprot:11188131-Lingulodinium_polyedra.AAC.1
MPLLRRARGLAVQTLCRCRVVVASPPPCRCQDSSGAAARLAQFTAARSRCQRRQLAAVRVATFARAVVRL